MVFYWCTNSMVVLKLSIINSPDSFCLSFPCVSYILSFNSSFFASWLSHVLWYILLNGAAASHNLFRFWKTSHFLLSSFMVINSDFSLSPITFPSLIALLMLLILVRVSHWHMLINMLEAHGLSAKRSWPSTKNNQLEAKAILSKSLPIM